MERLVVKVDRLVKDKGFLFARHEKFPQGVFIHANSFNYAEDFDSTQLDAFIECDVCETDRGLRGTNAELVQ